MTAAAARGVRISGLSHSYDKEPILKDVSLEVEPGESIALLGPSGCGKTTLLRLLAGLEKPSSGSIHVGETPVAGPEWVPPERRQVGMVFQDWALFPHLNVADNVGYGIAKSSSKKQQIAAALEMMELSDLSGRMPATLSGGQQQRVALARALAPRPVVLLLDEPFSNLDTNLRTEVRTEVRQLLSTLEITSIFVTHDQDEAFIVGDRVAVMRDGQIVQTATPFDIYHNPVDRWTAEFVGTVSAIAATAGSGVAQSSIGSLAVDSHFQGPVDLILRPEQLTLQAGGDAEVVLVEYYGHDTLVFVDTGNDQLRVRCGPNTNYSPGDRVTVHFIDTRALAFAKG